MYKKFVICLEQNAILATPVLVMGRFFFVLFSKGSVSRFFSGLFNFLNACFETCWLFFERQLLWQLSCKQFFIKPPSLVKTNIVSTKTKFYIFLMLYWFSINFISKKSPLNPCGKCTTQNLLFFFIFSYQLLLCSIKPIYVYLILFCLKYFLSHITLL